MSSLESVFDEKPEKIDICGSYYSSKVFDNVTFDEIPIVMPVARGGFGDVMATLKLAEGLKKEFPEKKVCVYFDRWDDYNIIKRLYPLFNPEDYRADLNGISVALCSESEISEVFGQRLVGIYSPVALGKLGGPECFLKTARINFYVEEYDLKKGLCLPALTENKVFEDAKGRHHLVLPTGFEPDGIGIHVDHAIQGVAPLSKRSLLDKLVEKGSLGDYYKRKFTDKYSYEFLGTDWGIAYYVDQDQFFSFIYALKNVFPDRKLTIFDFSPRCYKKYCCGTKNIDVLEIGPQQHDVFVDFLRACELPAYITGDASLSEAISLDKLFIHEVPRWKLRLRDNYLNLLQKMDGKLNINFEDGRDKVFSADGIFRLISDPELQIAAHRVNDFVIREKDIVKNLAHLIRESVKRYN